MTLASFSTLKKRKPHKFEEMITSWVILNLTPYPTYIKSFPFAIYTGFIARIFPGCYARMDSNIFLSVENGSSIMHENDRTEERHIYIRIYQSISVDVNVPVRLKR
ncbi:hypothetical protein CEXT_447591 [Caerostris extrusa]|uniref:Uncharacterized protein n=1 Tax=Caerostris extrusa TaxID=172846 RepID=A0AAV4VKA6_CAEEX|nr:hypothetical protein CEXT_447591 [Caerostris extrusa]